MSGSTENEELYRGMLSKCGGKVKTWNKRAMSLKTDYCLYYYKDGSKKHQGLISLRDPKFAVRGGEKGDCSWPKTVDINNTLVIVTTPRTYYMFAESAEEAREWQEQLAMAHVRMIEGLTLHRKAKVHTAPSVETGGGNEGAASSVPKRFQKNNRNKVTKRFQGDDENSDHDGKLENIELDEEDSAARNSYSSAPGERNSEDSSARSGSHSGGAPKRYKKKDRHMPTQRFQQEGEEEEGDDGFLMVMSMEDLRDKSSLTKSSNETVTDTAYEAVTIISKTEKVPAPATTPSDSATKAKHPKATSAPSPTTLIYDEIPGGKEGEQGGGILYEDLEIKGMTAGKSPSLPTASVHPPPNLLPKDTLDSAKPTVPVEESLYNRSPSPTSLPDAVYDLIGYNPEHEEDTPLARPNKPASTGAQEHHSEETLYDVVKAGNLEPLVEGHTLSYAEDSTEAHLTTEGAESCYYDNVVRPTTIASNSVLKTDSPPPLPQRNPSMVELGVPPLPTREPLKAAPASSQSPKTVPKPSNRTPSEMDVDTSRDHIYPLPMSSSDNVVVSSESTDTLNRAPLATPTPNPPVPTPRSPVLLPKSPVLPKSPLQSRVGMLPAGGEMMDAYVPQQQPPSPAPVQRSSFQLEPPASAPEEQTAMHSKDLQKTTAGMDDQPDMGLTPKDVSLGSQVTPEAATAVAQDSTHVTLDERHEETSQRSPQMGGVSRVPAHTDPDELLSSSRRSERELTDNAQRSPKHVELKDLNLFLRQQKKFAERDTTLVAEREINTQALKTVLSDMSLTSDKKAAFGELLREIEQQKHLTNEERYKWERERMKFESERQKFEEEKKQFQEEMERLKASMQK